MNKCEISKMPEPVEAQEAVVAPKPVQLHESKALLNAIEGLLSRSPVTLKGDQGERITLKKLANESFEIFLKRGKEANHIFTLSPTGVFGSCSTANEGELSRRVAARYAAELFQEHVAPYLRYEHRITTPQHYRMVEKFLGTRPSLSLSIDGEKVTISRLDNGGIDVTSRLGETAGQTSAVINPDGSSHGGVHNRFL